MESLNKLLQDTDRAENEFLNYFRDYSKLLYDFFDSKGIIITIRTSSDFKFVPMVQDKCLYGYGGNKTKVYSRHGLKSREEAEYIAFKKAFEYLEKKYEE